MRSGWRRVHFRDCVTMLSGGTPSKANASYWQGDIPWVSCKDMKTERIFDAEDHLTKEGAANGTRMVSPGTVLIVVRGMILANEFPVAVAKRSVAFNQDLKALKCAPWLNDQYLFYWLKARTYEILGVADEAAHGTKRLQTDRLQSLEIDVPPTQLQAAIVSVLCSYDDLIENNTRRIRILEEMAQMIYREWFVNFRFPGHENVRIFKSELGPIPEGWTAKCVTDAVLVNPETKIPKEGVKPFLPMGCLSDNSMLITDVEEREGNSGSKFKNGDTLFARITPCLEHAKTGFVQFLPAEDAVAFGSTEFIVLRSKTVCPEYVYLMARTDEFRENAVKSMSGATGRQRVQEACFNRFLIAQPDTKAMRHFQNLVGPMFRFIHILNCRNLNLRTTRDLLLPKLISGEIPVEAADEYDAELMENIAQPA